MPRTRVVDWLWIVLVTSCSDGTAPPPVGVSGNFEGRLLENPSEWYLGFSLNESGGVITGTGFVTVYPAYAAVVHGTYHEPEVELTIQPTGTGLTYTFVGALRGDTLSGHLHPGGPLPLAFEFIRTDTVAHGHHETELEGAIVRSETGTSFFAYMEQGWVALMLEPTAGTPRTTIRFEWKGHHYPDRGTFELSGNAEIFPRVFVAEMGGGGIVRHLPVRSGSITIDVSRRFALLGRYELVASDPAGNDVRLHGHFSAGCYSPYC